MATMSYNLKTLCSNYLVLRVSCKNNTVHCDMILNDFSRCSLVLWDVLSVCLSVCLSVYLFYDFLWLCIFDYICLSIYLPVCLFVNLSSGSEYDCHSYPSFYFYFSHFLYPSILHILLFIYLFIDNSFILHCLERASMLTPTTPTLVHHISIVSIMYSTVISFQYHE